MFVQVEPQRPWAEGKMSQQQQATVGTGTGSDTQSSEARTLGRGLLSKALVPLPLNVLLVLRLDQYWKGMWKILSLVGIRLCNFSLLF